MLYLVQSNQMEQLAKQLSAALQTRHPDMPTLMQEQILVQSPGMSTWLRLQIAAHNGIAAGVEFPLPSSFIWQLCHQLLHDVPKENAFTKAAMTWKLMELLPQLLDKPEFAPLADYLASQQAEPTSNAERNRQQQLAALKSYQLCGQIADIFDQYLVYRPDWISAWEQQDEQTIKLSAAQAWQPILWRALIDFNQHTLGQSQYHRANLHQALFDALDDPAQSLAGLPKRLFVFGISSMAPQTLDVLYHLAKRIDVVMFNLSPCQHYWGDIVDPKVRARMAVTFANKYQLSERWEEKLEVGNPILANNGKMGRELLDLILELPEAHTNFNFESYQAPAGDSLLSGIQDDILQLSTRGETLGPDTKLYLSVSGRRILTDTDDSLTLRSCHSPLREVETLHDHLLDMLSRHANDEQPLRPKDIVIMMPDVASYAPYIDAVFGAKQGQHYIPYAIADRGAAQESPLINSFLHLLAINQSRFSLSELLGILEVPAVLRRFDIDIDELALLRRWLEEAGVRWGRDSQSRREYTLPEFEQNSWTFGIKRLILGYSFSDSSDIYQDSLPFDGIEGQSAQALGKLLNFIETIDHYKEALAEQCMISTRVSQLTELLDALYDVDEQELIQLQTIREAISKLEQEIEDAGHTSPLPIEIVQNWFKRTLSESRVGQRYLAGSVNFCTLMPMRSIPFKLVCLLGMNDGVYPRTQHPVGFDLVAQHGPRKGDRSRRLDDRYLFLEALLSARQQLYISYIGNSERDNSERIASMLVSELIEYCQLCYLPQAFAALTDDSVTPQDIDAIEAAIKTKLIKHQPLQPFDERLFLNTDSRDNQAHSAAKEVQLSHSNQWCPAAINNYSDGTSDPSTSTSTKGKFITKALTWQEMQSPLAGDVTADQIEVELSALIRFFRNPAQYFFNRALKLDLNLNIQQDDNDEPFDINPLGRYQIQSTLIEDAIARSEPQPNASLLAQLKKAGHLPLAPFDELLLDKYLHDIKPLIGRTLYLKGEQSHNLTISLPLATQPAVTLVGRIDDISAKGLVNHRPGTANGRDLIRVYLRHLCICAMGSQASAKASYLLDIGHFHSFATITAAQAQQQLTLWLQYFIDGQAAPLLFMPRTALAYVEAEGDHQEKLLSAQSQWQDEQTGLGEGYEPHFQRLFTFPDDFTETEFGTTAQQLLQPLLSLYHKGKLDELADFVEAASDNALAETAATAQEAR
ncbi:exodeoxyribonuclease V subunit gamma [Shewanella sp. Scap07]|uniref:exodeoxyribonuclease V subunit gamma n=1 Tax=Shewanella sp. Scap07 TaxID=2589987 RepID=UPI0015BBD300|nr:exodeoxyribonuclease V subunit gamma [Shewanella sp. Scap07]QLE85737.1 exodeoxyribonuclease V subunit gamma [Shewanella sp. Scap07]